MAATDKVGHRMPRHHHLHSDSDAAVGDARPPPPPDGEVVEGVGVVCFVGDRWWQGRWVGRDASGNRIAQTLLGVAAPAARPGRKQFHHCCYPLGPPDLYDVECSTTGPDGSTATTELLDVERTPGDLPTLTSPGLVFQPAVVHTDELAAESIAALFPGIRPTARTVVCMGPMSLRLSAPTAGAVAT